MKKWIACLLALLLIVPCAHAEDFSFEGEGYFTPEEAALAYAEAFARGDVMGMLSTFAVETYVDHFDSAAYLSYIQIYRPEGQQAVLPLPYQEGYGRQLRVVDRASSIFSDFTNQYIAMSGIGEAASDPRMNGIMFSRDDPESLNAFLDTAARNAWPGSVTVGQVIARAATKDVQFGRRYSKSMDSIRAYAGCDETAAVGVMLLIDGQSYIQLLQCIRYGEKWYNHVLGGNAGSYISMTLNSARFSGGRTGLFPADEVLSLLQQAQAEEKSE